MLTLSNVRTQKPVHVNIVLNDKVASLLVLEKCTHADQKCRQKWTKMTF